MFTGTIVNALAILLGAIIGMGFQWAAGHLSGSLERLRGLGQRLEAIIMQGLALCVLLIGITGCLKGSQTLVTILSIVLGAILGELLDLDRRMRTLGDWVEKRTAHLVRGDGSVSVSEGFVTASLLFCVGAMAIVGALQDGLTGDHTTLFAKSMLDGITSIVFSASLGVGVALSAGAVLLYQGSIAALSSFLEPLLQTDVVAEMTCVGSLLIIALALNMLGLTKIKVMNLVPAIFLPMLLCVIL